MSGLNRSRTANSLGRLADTNARSEVSFGDATMSPSPWPPPVKRLPVDTLNTEGLRQGAWMQAFHVERWKCSEPSAAEPRRRHS